MKPFKILFSVTAFILLAGCSRIQPIMNITNAPVAYPLTAQDVKQALTQAATGHHWIVSEVKPGQLKAEIFVRSHHAMINMTYSAKFYSIQYGSSNNLKYNDGHIHRTYNRWIKYLNIDTQKNLARIAATQSVIK